MGFIGGPSSALDLPRRIVKELAQAAFMRIILPFLDSPLPILRGDETVLTLLLAQLLEFNTGLSSPLSKDPVASSTSSTAYMLSATTSSRNQIRAVSGANMTESPIKLLSHPNQASQALLHLVTAPQLRPDTSLCPRLRI